MKIIGYLLQFLERNRHLFNITVTEHESEKYHPRYGYFPMVILLNENFQDLYLQTYLKLLSQTDVYGNDDTAFVELITSQLTCGRDPYVYVGIDKTLTVLRDDLNRQNVATKIWRHVFETEPKLSLKLASNQQKTEPPNRVSVSKESIGGWLLWLLERDELKLTRLHLEALNNNKENVKEILDQVARIVSPSEGETQVIADIHGQAEKVISLMAQDDEGFTPLYVAIVCGHEEICHIMLSFLKRYYNAHKNESKTDEDQLPKKLTENNGALYQALLNSIRNLDVARMKLVLKTVKREFGQDCLLALLKSDGPNFYLDPNRAIPIPIFASRKPRDDANLFGTMVEMVISVDCDGISNTKDYKGLNDLIFHCKHTTESLLCEIDADTLRGMVSATNNGISNWIRRLLNTSLNEGFKLILSSRFLEILTENELEKLLDTITEKTSESATSYWENFEVTHYYKELVLEFFTFLSKHEEVDANSWFKLLVLSYNDGIIDRKGYKSILRLQTLVDAVLEVAAQELRNQVIPNVKKRAPLMIEETFFSSSTSPRPKTDLPSASDSGYDSSSDTMSDSGIGVDFTSGDGQQCFSEITGLPTNELPRLLLFYLHFGSDDQLKKFVDAVTVNRDLKEEGQCSIWKHLFGKDHYQEMIELLKIFSEKERICGQNAITEILIYKVNKFPFLLAVALRGVDVSTNILDYLPKGNRDEMDNFLKENVPRLIDETFDTQKTHFERANYYKILNLLFLFLNFAMENQLKDFIKNITIIKCSTEELENIHHTIWGGITIDKIPSDGVEMMSRFMKYVSEKLGQEAVVQLVLHDYGKGAAILHPMRRGERDMVEAMIACLDNEKREEVLHSINKQDPVLGIYQWQLEK